MAMGFSGWRLLPPLLSFDAVLILGWPSFLERNSSSREMSVDGKSYD
jgi:hypothetical protein